MYLLAFMQIFLVGLIPEEKRMPNPSTIFYVTLFLTILLVNQEMTSVLKCAEYIQLLYLYLYISIYLYYSRVLSIICIHMYIQYNIFNM